MPNRPEPFNPAPGEPPKKKKKDKVRGAWISFVGRVVAQVVGAVVSIALAIFFLQRNQSDVVVPAESAPPAAATGKPRVVAADRRITIAVLPLSNYSGDPQQDYFADGMTEALIAELVQEQAFRVISRTSVMQYRAHQKPLPQVAAELGADMIVEGSVVRAGNRVRVTAQLIDGATDDHLWAHSYDDTMRDVLALQGQMAAAIVKEVTGALTPRQRGRLLTQRRPIDPAAYDLYLRGRHAWSLRTATGFDLATSYFEQAIAKDPGFALAYAGLADIYVLPGNRPNAPGPVEARAKALAAIATALELDDSLAEAHTSRGALAFFNERDFVAAEAAFRRALELNPGYPTAHQWYAILLAELGRDGEALTHAQEAITLDPLSGMMRQALGHVHYYGRRYGDAATELRRAVELAPQLPLARALLVKVLFQQGAYAEAVAAGEAMPPPRAADQLAILGLAYLRAGDTSKANAILKALESRQPVPVVALAQWYAVAGRPDRALAVLSRGDQAALANLVAVDPLFDAVRAEPRFGELLAKRGRV